MAAPITSATLDTRIVANAEKAWRLLSELKLLPTPENYAVFFAFCEGKDERLTLEVNDALGKYQLDPGRLGNAMQMIYEKSLSAMSHEAAVQKTATLFEAEMKQIMDMVSNAQKGADEYGEQLDEFGKGIASAPIEQVKTLVAGMMEQTKQMAQQNQSLQDQLTLSLDQVNELKTNLDTVKQESLRDPLTGINNRKAFTAELIRASNDARAHNEDLSIAMVDIDFFKKFNDKYGHLVGDQVLKLVASTLKENIKGRDTVARWGGEEFAVLLPQTRMDFAVKLADSLRNVVANKKIIRKPQNEDLGQITLSIGVTQYVYGEDMNDFVDRADQALYRAKQEGRNRVVSNDPPVTPHIDTKVTGSTPEKTVSITTEA
ncbi:MAG: GGDEF domain-containing protein [Bdellovibrionales bacterium]